MKPLISIVITLGAYVVCIAILNIVFPTVLLAFFDGSDAKLASYLGWVSSGVCVLQFFTQPTLTALSDVWGRKRMVIGAAGTQALAAFAWAIQPNNVYVATIATVIGGVCGVISPLALAAVGDLARSGGKTAVHGFGLVSSTFGIGLVIGPLLGGWLTTLHKTAACMTAGAFALAGTLVAAQAEWDGGGGSRLNTKSTRHHKHPKMSLNPMNILPEIFKPLTESAGVARLAVVYAFFTAAVGAFSTWYPLLDYKFNWQPVRVGYFLACYGLAISVLQVVLVRGLIPKIIPEGVGLVIGLVIQGISLTVFGAASSSWQMYAGIPIGALAVLGEPCLQALMVAAIDPAYNGRLQGAVASLRIIAQGFSAPAYGALFAYSIDKSNTFKRAIPGLCFYVGSIFDVFAALVAGWSLYKGHRRAHICHHRSLSSTSASILDIPEMEQPLLSGSLPLTSPVTLSPTTLTFPCGFDTGYVDSPRIHTHAHEHTTCIDINSINEANRLLSGSECSHEDELYVDDPTAGTLTETGGMVGLTARLE